MADIYIDPTSATNGAGTIGDPKNTWVGLTWTAGNSYLQKYGTTFTTASGSGGRIAPSVSGTAGARITLGAYGDPTLGLPIIQSNADTGINLDQRSYITVENLEIRGSTVSGIGGGGAAAASMVGVIVRNNRLRDAGNMGMSFQTQLDRLPTIDLEVYGNEVINPGYHGIHCMGEHQNTVVRNNRITGGGLVTPGHGISAIPHRATSTPTWTLVSGTIYSTPIGAQSYKTTVAAIYGVRYAASGASLLRNTATPTAPASGEFGFSSGLLYINVGGVPSGSITFSYTSLQVKIRDNVITDYGNAQDAESKGIQFDDLARDCEAVRNLIVNPRAEGIACNMGQGNLIAGNVVINPRDQGIRADINGAKNNLVYHNTLIAGTSTQPSQVGVKLGFGNTAKNNVIVGFAVGVDGASAACIAANNAYWKCTAQSSGTLTDQGGNVLSDPLLDAWYRPTFYSPLKAAGQSLGIVSDARSAPFKSPPAIGAYESYALDEKNVVFCWTNRIDEATLSSSGTWQATLPLANLQNRVLATVARSNMSLLTDPDIVIDLGQARRIGVVALVAHNLSVVATLRVEGATDAGFTAGVYDSGFFNVWPSGVVDADWLEWEDDNFWLGTVSAEARAGYQAPCIHLLPAAEIARYWRITLHDPGNADGYLQAGRVFLSDVWQPAANYSYGAQLGYEDRSGVAESLGGTEFFDSRAKFRVHRLTLDWLSESEGYNRLIEMQRQIGQTGELLVIPDPSDAANMPRRAMLGRIAKLTPLEHAMTDRTRSTLEIKEIL